MSYKTDNSLAQICLGVNSCASALYLPQEGTSTYIIVGSAFATASADININPRLFTDFIVLYVIEKIHSLLYGQGIEVVFSHVMDAPHYHSLVSKMEVYIIAFGFCLLQRPWGGVAKFGFETSSKG